LGDGFCHKRVAPTGAPAFQRRLFNSAREFLDTPLLATLKVATATKAGEPLMAKAQPDP
jgi:hypothetical protein